MVGSGADRRGLWSRNQGIFNNLTGWPRWLELQQILLASEGGAGSNLAGINSFFVFFSELCAFVADETKLEFLWTRRWEEVKQGVYYTIQVWEFDEQIPLIISGLLSFKWDLLAFLELQDDSFKNREMNHIIPKVTSDVKKAIGFIADSLY